MTGSHKAKTAPASISRELQGSPGGADDSGTSTTVLPSIQPSGVRSRKASSGAFEPDGATLRGTCANTSAPAANPGGDPNESDIPSGPSPPPNHSQNRA